MSHASQPETYTQLDRLARQRYRLSQELATEKRRHRMAMEQITAARRRMDAEICAFIETNKLFQDGSRSLTTNIATYRLYDGTTKLLGIKPNNAFPVYRSDYPKPREIFVKRVRPANR